MRRMPTARAPWFSLLVCLLAASPAGAQQHPLDPLTTGEIEIAARILTAAPQFPRGGKFATIVLKEPAKAAVLAFTPGSPVARQAFGIVLDRPANRTFEGVVDVTGSRLVSWRAYRSGRV